MNRKRISALTSHFNTIEISGPDNWITGIAYDSRDVGKGSLFFALPGIHTDGHAFIDQAVRNGAAGIVYTDDSIKCVPRVTYVRTEDARKALSPAAAAFYDFPSTELRVIGVTGTDGKSTTVYFIYQLLCLSGASTGFISTVNYLVQDTILSNPYRQSTPEAPGIHGVLRQMMDNGKEYAVIEATSHGLSEKNSRLQDVDFDAAVLTNLSHEHLEFHGTFEQYRYDKANLFRMIHRQQNTPSPGFGVVNLADPNAGYFQKASIAPVYTYGLDLPEADLSASVMSSSIGGTRFEVIHNGKPLQFDLAMPGVFNVENVLAALLAVGRIRGIDIEDFRDMVPGLLPVPGRMQAIHMGQPFSCIVDYAHTPGSFTRLLPMMREYTKGKLIILFGSAGERDFEKRPIQGSLADKWGDIIILTDEDPRGEESMTILEEIAAGIKRKSLGIDLYIIPDRKEAVRKACSLAGREDTILLLGKGHESSIIYRDGPVEWNEGKTAGKVLSRLGYTGFCHSP